MVSPCLKACGPLRGTLNDWLIAHRPHKAKPGPLARLAAPLLLRPLTPSQSLWPLSGDPVPWQGLHSGTSLGLESAAFLSQTKCHFSEVPCFASPFLYLPCYSYLPIYNY